MMIDHFKRYIKLAVNTAIVKIIDKVNRTPIGESTNYKTMLFYLAKILKKSPSDLTESEIEKIFCKGAYGGAFDNFKWYCDRVLAEAVSETQSDVLHSAYRDDYRKAVERRGYLNTEDDLRIAFYDKLTKYLAKEVKKPLFKDSIKNGKTSNTLSGKKSTVPSKTHNGKKIYPPFVNVRKML